MTLQVWESTDGTGQKRMMNIFRFKVESPAKAMAKPSRSSSHDDDAQKDDVREIAFEIAD